MLRKRGGGTRHRGVHYGTLAETTSTTPTEVMLKMLMMRRRPFCRLVEQAIVLQLSCFILIFKYLIANETGVGRTRQEVENQGAQSAHDEGDKEYYAVCLARQEVPVKRDQRYKERKLEDEVEEFG